MPEIAVCGSVQKLISSILEPHVVRGFVVICYSYAEHFNFKLNTARTTYNSERQIICNKAFRFYYRSASNVGARRPRENGNFMGLAMMLKRSLSGTERCH